MAEVPGADPLAERHLADESRLDPVRSRPRQRAEVERGRAFQAGQRPGEGGVIEASADLSGICQPAVAVVR